jgi:hypothetical protein
LFKIAHQESQAIPIINAIPILVAKSKLSGICEEADLDEHIGSIDNGFFKSPIDNMEQRCMIQQRALWLNKEGVINKRIIDNNKKIAANNLAQQKKDNASKKKEMKQKLEQAQQQDIDVAKSGPPPIGTWCSGECKKLATSLDVPGTDWMGCNGLAGCTNWYCSAKACITKLNRHRIICCARKAVI